MLEHKSKEYNSEKSKNKLLYLAFDKYGLENFSFEIIEDDVENYNEREKYWIAYYHNYINDKIYGNNKGYNMAPGGEQPLIKSGESHYCTKHTQQEIDVLIKELQSNQLTFQEISEKYQEPLYFLRKINTGTIWRKENFQYPLRKIQSKEQLDRALNIIFDLLNTNDSETKIAKRYNVARSIVTMINIGQSFYQKDLIYPLNMNRINSIREDLKNNILKQYEIANKYNVSRQTIRNINLGISFFDERIDYPIRKNK